MCMRVNSLLGLNTKPLIHLYHRTASDSEGEILRQPTVSGQPLRTLACRALYVGAVYKGLLYIRLLYRGPYILGLIFRGFI